MTEISRIELFLKVVKYKSFSGAGKTVGMTGSAISKQVQALEEELGVKLLNRTTRQVTLTEEGAIYSERARKALEDLNEAEKQIQDLKAHAKGLLRINAPMAFGKKYLTKPIADFAKKYPEVKLEVDFDDRHVDVIAEKYDVVIRIGALEDSTLIARKLADCPVLLCAAPKLLRKFKKPKSPEDLKNYPAVIYNKHSNNNEWRYVDKNGEIGSIQLQRQFAANNATMMEEACLEGIGIAQLPIFVAIEHLESGKLVEVLPEYETHPQRNIYAVFPQNRYLSTKTRLFVDYLSKYSKKLPW